MFGSPESSEAKVEALIRTGFERQLFINNKMSNTVYQGHQSLGKQKKKHS